MPYGMKRKGNRYQVVNTETGKVYSTTTREKAQKQLALLKSLEKGYTETGDGEFTRTVNGKKQRIRVK